MPIFEYDCGDCGERYEEIVLGDSRQPRCPSCGSEAGERRLSVFAAHGSGQRAEAAPAMASCGSCGDPRGPGSCRIEA